MKHATLSLDFLTPAFLGGAWPKREGTDGPAAELRPASILGQLRWWHRALGRQDSEERIFGSVAGEAGRAGGFSLQIQDPPPPVKSATPPMSLGLERSYFLYAQEMDNGANLRAALPAGSSFRLVLINRRLGDGDWQLLLKTANTFGQLGSLGNRSRRGFGALRLTEWNGKPAATVHPDELLRPSLACAFPDDCQPAPDAAPFLTNAGNWLREARRRLKEDGKDKSRYFGRIAGNRESRLASPILLRPWPDEENLKLLLIGPKALVEDVAFPSSAAADMLPAPNDRHGDPVARLLAPPLSFERFTVIQETLEQWRAEGRADLVGQLLEKTLDPKYSGLRSQPWFPKSSP